MKNRIDLILPESTYIPGLLNDDFYYSIKENKDFSDSLKENGKYELYLIDKHSGKEKHLGNFEHDGKKLVINLKDISEKNWKTILQTIGYETSFDVIKEKFQFKNGKNATLIIDAQKSKRTMKIENFETDERETNFKEFIENIEQIPNEFYIYFEMNDYDVEDIEFMQKFPNGNEFSCTITSYDHLKNLKILDAEKPFEIYCENPKKAKMENLEISEAMIIESSKIQINSIGEIGELIQNRADDFYRDVFERKERVLKVFDKTNENKILNCLKAFKSEVPIKVQNSNNTLTLIKEFPNKIFIDKETNKKIKFDNKNIVIKNNKSSNNENIYFLIYAYKKLSKLEEFKQFKNVPILLDNNDTIVEINKGKLKQLSGKPENLEKIEKNLNQSKKIKTR